jgi:hypothetical protein
MIIIKYYAIKLVDMSQEMNIMYHVYLLLFTQWIKLFNDKLSTNINRTNNICEN